MTSFAGVSSSGVKFSQNIPPPPPPPMDAPIDFNNPILENMLLEQSKHASNQQRRKSSNAANVRRNSNQQQQQQRRGSHLSHGGENQQVRARTRTKSSVGEDQRVRARTRTKSSGGALLNFALGLDHKEGANANANANANADGESHHIQQMNDLDIREGSLDWRGSMEEPVSWSEMAAKVRVGEKVGVEHVLTPASIYSNPNPRLLSYTFASL